MNDKTTDTNLSIEVFEDAYELLKASLNKEDLQVLIPMGDALRIWWSPEEENMKIKELLEVIEGSNDYLSLLALIQYARTKIQPTKDFENKLKIFLCESSINFRNSSLSYKSHYHAFVSYSHLDKNRVKVILSILTKAGLKIFHDVEEILPGESIVGRLHEVMLTAPRAILIISENYLQSAWTSKELQVFLERRQAENFKILPVLIDYIDLPEPLEDIFTIDLRGFQNETDIEWAKKKLQKLINTCLLND